jgi:acetylornithine deacetylase/succinyl-diaminopimelate desuccinylase-like protein
MKRFILLLVTLTAAAVSAQAPREPEWTSVREEILRHFQSLVRLDTTDPPGGERPVAEYLKQVLEREGIPVRLLALEGHRPNLVARLKGSGKRRPLLIMGHTDTVNVDPKKWTFPPFSAALSAGHIYGRGTLDDKDNVVAALMSMLMLKRLNVPLDRDVIFLAEAGEEGTTRLGIQFMVNQHFSEIDAEFCFAEGGGILREGGRVKYATVQTLEKIPRGIDLTARGPAGHGSIPLRTNAVAHLASAVAKIAAWKPPLSPNETTAGYFKRLASVSAPDAAERYQNVLDPDPKISGPADDYLFEREPRLAALLHHSVSPNIVQAGYRINVIPSEAKATLDVRLLPHDDDPAKFIEEIRKVVNDPAVDVSWAQRDVRPGNPAAPLDSDAFRLVEVAVTKHYGAITIPTMSTGATDMAYLRAKGIHCYGIGPATDVEDGPLGFGSHSDQERILEEELHRFVRFHYDLVAGMARAR